MMKALGIVLVLAALVIGIVPQFTDCASQGHAITLANGRQIPMKCHWTGQASQALALPIFAVGALVGLNRRREVVRNLGIVGLGLAAVAILLPTVLIGVCADPDMICNSTMRPILILTGSVVGLASLVGVVMAARERDVPAETGVAAS